jgi:hypothetical protein
MPSGPSIPPSGSVARSSVEIERSLTENEAAVVSSLLAGTSEGEELRIKRSGVPRTSYREAKRRLFASGVLVERFLPHPDLLYALRVSFLLSRPHSNELSTAIGALDEDPSTALLWSGDQLVLAVQFHTSLAAGEALHRRVASGSYGQPLVAIAADPKAAQVPVFFDFEGAWNHFMGLPGTVGYPRPLPGNRPLPPRGPPIVRAREALRPLVQAGAAGEPETAANHGTGIAGLPRAQRRLLDGGSLAWRTLLRPDRSPEFKGRGLSTLIAVVGNLRQEGQLFPLFRDLARDCGVAPILLASDGRKVLLLSLGTGLDQVEAARPEVRPRAPVRPVLARHLVSFDSLREPTGRLRVHRYLEFGRLLGG